MERAVAVRIVDHRSQRPVDTVAMETCSGRVVLVLGPPSVGIQRVADDHLGGDPAMQRQLHPFGRGAPQRRDRVPIQKALKAAKVNLLAAQKDATKRLESRVVGQERATFEIAQVSREHLEAGAPFDQQRPTGDRVTEEAGVDAAAGHRAVAGTEFDVVVNRPDRPTAGPEAQRDDDSSDQGWMWRHAMTTAGSAGRWVMGLRAACPAAPGRSPIRLSTRRISCDGGEPGNRQRQFHPASGPRCPAPERPGPAPTSRRRRRSVRCSSPGRTASTFGASAIPAAA